MSRIQLFSAGVRFPIYDARHRSLKQRLLAAATGGKIVRSPGQVPVIESLRDVSLDIREGERVALWGHNGAGKTTLLRVLAGVYHPSSGSISVDGTVTSLLEATFGMDPESTGWENIYLRGLFVGLNRSNIDSVIDDIAAFSELGGYLDMPVRTYSSGMILRLAFSVSTALAPDILLMDEWLSVGDESFRHKAEERLRRMVDKARILVIATHDPQLIRSVCNRVIWMEHGAVREDAPLGTSTALPA